MKARDIRKHIGPEYQVWTTLADWNEDLGYSIRRNKKAVTLDANPNAEEVDAAIACL